MSIMKDIENAGWSAVGLCILVIAVILLVLFLLLSKSAVSAELSVPQGNPFFKKNGNVSFGAFIESFGQCGDHEIDKTNCFISIPAKEYTDFLIRKEHFPPPPSGDLATELGHVGRTRKCVGFITLYYRPRDGSEPRTWTRKCHEGEEIVYIEGYGDVLSLYCGNPVRDPNRVAGSSTPPVSEVVEKVRTVARSQSSPTVIPWRREPSTRCTSSSSSGQYGVFIASYSHRILIPTWMSWGNNTTRTHCTPGKLVYGIVGGASLQ